MMGARTIRGLRPKLKDAGITLMDSLNDAIVELIDTDKLLLIYFHEIYSFRDNNFYQLLRNKDVNKLFASDFIIYITSSNKLEPEFALIMKEKMGNVNNQLYVFIGSGGEVELLSKMDGFGTPKEDMLYTLFQMQCSNKENLHARNEKYIEKCSKDYLPYSWTNEFKYVALEDAINVTMNQPVKHLRKMLMLYMYKSGSDLAEKFNKFLAAGIFKKYNRILIPIIWNISDRKYHKALKYACQRYFDQDILEKTVSSMEGGIFFFMPDAKKLKSSPRIFTQITSLDGLSCFMRTKEYLFNEFQTSNAITDLYEIEAIDFYTSQRPLFKLVERNSLHEIIEKCMQIPRKLLLLYFSNYQSKLINVIPKIQSLLHKEQVVFLPWNITDSKRNLILATALQRSFGLKKMETLLKLSKSALFIFLPIGNTMVLHSLLNDDASISAIRNAYKAAHRFFMLESTFGEDADNITGPAAFQQIMCDQLEDRDFDCFQLDKGQGVELRKKVAFAYFGPPSNSDGTYNDSSEQQITKATNKITEEASMFGENKNILYVSFMRVCISPLPEEKHKKVHADKEYHPVQDFGAFPLFSIRKCFNCPKGSRPCRKYVDHVGRVYQDWEDFLENNKYPKVMLIAPKDGKYTNDYRGNVQLEICPSPACGIGVAVLRGVDIGASVAGIIAAPICAISALVAIPFLPIVGIGTGVVVGTYSIVRSSMTLANRSRYHESMSIAEAEARGAYLNIIAGSLGFTTSGAGFAMAYAARTGADIGIAARSVMNGLTIANLTASGAAVGNSAYDVIARWVDDGTPDPLTLIQMASSILFFGHAVYNAQFAHTIIGNNQTSVISEILDSLSGNRQRKTLLRLINTTTEQHGSALIGNSQVIKYIKTLDNVQEVVKILTRDTKLMSRNGVKFSIENGKMVFNGVEMNVKDFGNMSKIQRSDALSTLASEAKITRKYSSPIKSVTENIVTIENALIFYRRVEPVLGAFIRPGGTFSGVEQLLSCFTSIIQRILMNLMGKVLQKVGMQKSDLYSTLSDLYDIRQLPLTVMKILIEFYWEKSVQSCISDKVKPYSDIIIRVMDKMIIISQLSIHTVIEQIIDFMSKWVLQELIKRRTNVCPNFIERRQMKVCDKCKGKFYQE